MYVYFFLELFCWGIGYFDFDIFVLMIWVIINIIVFLLGLKDIELGDIKLFIWE